MTVKQAETIGIAWVVLCLLFGFIMQECDDANAAEKFSFKGRAVEVMDGDTIKVLKDSKATKVRLYGIDCPEKGQAFGQVAKKFTLDKVGGKTITVTVVDSDRYGRLIGKVETVTGQDLGEELLKAGLAWWYQQYAPHDTRYQLFEKQAKDNKVGLWADPSPTPPWRWRRQ